MNDNIPLTLNQTFGKTKMILLIQLFSVIGLIVFGWFWASEVDNSVTPNAIRGLWLVAIFFTIGTLLIQRWLFAWKNFKSIYQQKQIKGLLNSLQINTIFLGVIAQIIAIIGFMIATLSVNKFEMFRAGAMSLVIFMFIFPRKKIWEKIVDNIEK